MTLRVFRQLCFLIEWIPHLSVLMKHLLLIQQTQFREAMNYYYSAHQNGNIEATIRLGSLLEKMNRIEDSSRQFKSKYWGERKSKICKDKSSSSIFWINWYNLCFGTCDWNISMFFENYGQIRAVIMKINWFKPFQLHNWSIYSKPE